MTTTTTTTTNNSSGSNRGATPVQLAALMPSSGTPLLLGDRPLTPPPLPLEEVTFQSMFGPALQKELDHYLT